MKYQIVTKEMPLSVFEAVRVDCDECGHPVIISLENPNKALLAEVKEKVGNLAVILYDEAQSPTDTPKIGHSVDLQQVLDILTEMEK